MISSWHCSNHIGADSDSNYTSKSREVEESNRCEDNKDKRGGKSKNYVGADLGLEIIVDPKDNNKGKEASVAPIDELGLVLVPNKIDSCKVGYTSRGGEE